MYAFYMYICTAGYMQCTLCTAGSTQGEAGRGEGGDHKGDAPLLPGVHPGDEVQAGDAGVPGGGRVLEVPRPHGRVC